MTPARKGDGTGLSFPGYSEVRTGDGDVVWTAGADIPDSGLLHDWEASNFDGSLWTDQEGTLDLSAGGDPTLNSGGYNGEDAVELDGSGDMFSATGLDLSPPYVVFTVLDLTDNGNIAKPWGGQSGNRPELLYRFDQTLEYRLEPGGGSINGGTATANQEIVSVRVEEGSQEIWRNATSEVTGSVAGTETWTDVDVGYHQESDAYTQGQIARQMVYDYSQMESGQIGDVESYLNDIYGVY